MALSKEFIEARSKLQKQHEALENQINNNPKGKNDVPSGPGSAHESLKKEWGKANDEFKKLHANLTAQEAETQITKIYEQLAQKTKEVILEAERPTGWTDEKAYPLHMEAVNDYYKKEIEKLKLQHLELLKKAEENKADSLYDAMYALQKLDAGSKSSPFKITLEGESGTPYDTSKFQETIADFNKNGVFTGIPDNEQKFSPVQFVGGDGKDKKDSIVVNNSTLHPDHNLRSARMGVVLAAGKGWKNISLSGGKEKQRIAAMQEAVTLPGMMAKIVPEEGSSLSKSEQRWNKLLTIKTDLLKNQELTPSKDTSEISEYYQAVQKEGNPELTQLFLSSLRPEHINEIADSLKGDKSKLAQFHTSLGNFIADKKNQDSPLVRKFDTFSDDIKQNVVQGLLLAAKPTGLAPRLSDSAPKYFVKLDSDQKVKVLANAAASSTSNLVPCLKTMNVKELTELAVRVDGLRDPDTGLFSDYAHDLRDQITDFITDSFKADAKFNNKENIDNFVKLPPGLQAKIFLDLPEKQRQTLLDGVKSHQSEEDMKVRANLLYGFLEAQTALKNQGFWTKSTSWQRSINAIPDLLINATNCDEWNNYKAAAEASTAEADYPMMKKLLNDGNKKAAFEDFLDKASGKDEAFVKSKKYIPLETLPKLST